MKFVFFAFLLLGLVGCGGGEVQQIAVTVDTCQYIVIKNRSGLAIVHKGDCASQFHGGISDKKGKAGIAPINTGTGWTTVALKSGGVPDRAAR